jgi:hypothetical protein
LVVHGLDPAGTDRRELSGDDGREEERHGQDLLGQPLARDRDASRRQALMLAIQGKVVQELVDVSLAGVSGAACDSLPSAARRLRH